MCLNPERNLSALIYCLPIPLRSAVPRSVHPLNPRPFTERSQPSSEESYQDAEVCRNLRRSPHRDSRLGDCDAPRRRIVPEVRFWIRAGETLWNGGRPVPSQCPSSTGVPRYSPLVHVQGRCSWLCSLLLVRIESREVSLFFVWVWCSRPPGGRSSVSSTPREMIPRPCPARLSV